MKRPWAIYYLNAESQWVRFDERSFHFKKNAERAMDTSALDQPGVLFTVRKHVEFESDT
jgi:hypothetical protein